MNAKVPSLFVCLLHFHAKTTSLIFIKLSKHIFEGIVKNKKITKKNVFP